MKRTKLTLDIGNLEVSSFVTGELDATAGTVHANEAVPLTRTVCLTTPNCPYTVSCPTAYEGV
jgi:hypothetical protein